MYERPMPCHGRCEWHAAFRARVGHGPTLRSDLRDWLLNRGNGDLQPRQQLEPARVHGRPVPGHNHGEWHGAFRAGVGHRLRYRSDVCYGLLNIRHCYLRRRQHVDFAYMYRCDPLTSLPWILLFES